MRVPSGATVASEIGDADLDLEFATEWHGALPESHRTTEQNEQSDQKPSAGHILQWLWMMMTNTVEPIREGRSYERKKRVKRKRFPSNYKPLR